LRTAAGNGRFAYNQYFKIVGHGSPERLPKFILEIAAARESSAR
jgi:hypothetical protein